MPVEALPKFDLYRRIVQAKLFIGGHYVAWANQSNHRWGGAAVSPASLPSAFRVSLCLGGGMQAGECATLGWASKNTAAKFIRALEVGQQVRLRCCHFRSGTVTGHN